MDIYIVTVEDRHADAEIYLFTDYLIAIEWARNYAINMLKKGDELKTYLTPQMAEDGWLYCVEYSPEGGRVRVSKKILEAKWPVTK